MDTQAIKTHDAATAINGIEELDLNSAKDLAAIEALEGETLPADAKTPFDGDDFYKGMSRDDVRFFRAAADEIRQYVKQSDRIIGTKLKEVRDAFLKIKGRSFEEWLKNESHNWNGETWAKATAYRYINVVEKLGDTPELIDALPTGISRALASPSTSETLRDEIKAEVKAGNIPTPDEVKTRIADAQEAAKQEREKDQAKKQAEKEADAEKKEWEKKEAALKKAGSSDDDILKERQTFDTAKAKKQREKDRKEAAAKAKEDDRKREREKVEAEYERKKANAKAAAALIATHFTGNKGDLLALLSDTDWHSLREETIAAIKAQDA